MSQDLVRKIIDDLAANRLGQFSRQNQKTLQTMTLKKNIKPNDLINAGD